MGSCFRLPLVFQVTFSLWAMFFLLFFVILSNFCFDWLPLYFLRRSCKRISTTTVFSSRHLFARGLGPSNDALSHILCPRTGLLPTITKFFDAHVSLMYRSTVSREECCPTSVRIIHPSRSSGMKNCANR